MRLCFISEPNVSHTRRWVNWFNEHGHETCLIADTQLRIPWENQSIIKLTEKSQTSVVKFFFWLMETKKVLNQWKPDILHAHRVSSAGWLGAFSGFHPFVVTPWGSDLYLHPNRSAVARHLARYVLRSADLVTADSSDLCQTAVTYGANPSVVKPIQWGVDQNIFKPGADKSRIRQSFGILKKPVILSIRAVNPTYNLTTLIQAFAPILEYFPNAVLVLREYNTSNEYLEILKKLIAGLGIVDSVHWIGAVEPWEKLADIYALADIAVSVPISDGTPVSVLEAMACGIPVIASDLPSLREWIVDQENGYLVPVHQPQVLTSRILQLLNRLDLAETFSRRNLEIIQERANHDLEMRKMERLYQKLLDSRCG